MTQEIDIRLNKLEYTAGANVTTSAQTIEEIFTSIPAVAKNNMKTLIVHNTAATDIFFGANASVTVATGANGGAPINGAETREFPMHALENSPYFIAGVNTDLRIEIWS